MYYVKRYEDGSLHVYKRDGTRFQILAAFEANGWLDVEWDDYECNTWQKYETLEDILKANVLSKKMVVLLLQSEI